MLLRTASGPVDREGSVVLGLHSLSRGLAVQMMRGAQ